MNKESGDMRVTAEIRRRNAEADAERWERIFSRDVLPPDTTTPEEDLHWRNLNSEKE